VTEREWLSATDPQAMQEHLLAAGVSTRRLQLFVFACGELIWDVITPEAQTAFEALRHTAEGTDTPQHKYRLEQCGALKDWLGWILSYGGPPSEVVACVREVFGNPFRPVHFDSEWRTDTAVSLARQMYDSQDFSAMPILADALQDAGCDNADVLNHCRDTTLTHVRGCWVVDLVLGKM
jgi:hypothetical protein